MDQTESVKYGEITPGCVVRHVNLSAGGMRFYVKSIVRGSSDGIVKNDGVILSHMNYVGGNALGWIKYIKDSEPQPIEDFVVDYQTPGPKLEETPTVKEPLTDQPDAIEWSKIPLSHIDRDAEFWAKAADYWKRQNDTMDPKTGKPKMKPIKQQECFKAFDKILDLERMREAENNLCLIKSGKLTYNQAIQAGILQSYRSFLGPDVPF
jgi:hypothetical protein